MLLETLLLSISMCCFQDKFSSMITPKKFVTCSLLICISSIRRLGKVCGRNCLFERGLSFIMLYCVVALLCCIVKLIQKKSSCVRIFFYFIGVTLCMPRSYFTYIYLLSIRFFFFMASASEGLPVFFD